MGETKRETAPTVNDQSRQKDGQQAELESTWSVFTVMSGVGVPLTFLVLVAGLLVKTAFEFSGSNSDSGVFDVVEAQSGFIQRMVDAATLDSFLTVTIALLGVVASGYIALSFQSDIAPEMRATLANYAKVAMLSWMPCGTLAVISLFVRKEIVSLSLALPIVILFLMMASNIGRFPVATAEANLKFLKSEIKRQKQNTQDLKRRLSFNPDPTGDGEASDERSLPAWRVMLGVLWRIVLIALIPFVYLWREGADPSDVVAEAALVAVILSCFSIATSSLFDMLISPAHFADHKGLRVFNRAWKIVVFAGWSLLMFNLFALTDQGVALRLSLPYAAVLSAYLWSDAWARYVTSRRLRRWIACLALRPLFLRARLASSERNLRSLRRRKRSYQEKIKRVGADQS